jgi:hypothetical protein
MYSINWNGIAVTCENKEELSALLKVVASLPAANFTPTETAKVETAKVETVKETGKKLTFKVSGYEVDREYCFFKVTPSLQGLSAIRKGFKEAITQLGGHAYWKKDAGKWGCTKVIPLETLQHILA